MKVAVVIVNYRTSALTVDCLRSLLPDLEGIDAHVYVTDNASGDDSVAAISDAIAANGWGGRVTLMPLARNGGFAWGNNQAIRHALEQGQKPPFLWLLNPDTVVRPGALQALLDRMSSRPHCGIAGSRLEDPDGTPQRSAFRFPGVAAELDGGMRLGALSKVLSKYVIAPPPPSEAERIDWVAGASMLLRRELLEQVGLFDEAYFMYFEEVDLCLRAARAGWECWYVPASRVVHLVGQASGVTDPRQSRKRRPAYWFESRRRYFVKNHGRAYAAMADLAWTAGFAAWRLRRRVQRKPDVDPQHLLGDSLRHSVFARGFGT